MKWKRSKKAQQEAKAKAAADRVAKQNGITLPPAPKTENKSKRITEEDEAMSGSDLDGDDEIDVGGEDSDPMPNSPPAPNLIAPTPIMGLPHPPALQLRPLLHQQMGRPPMASDHLETSLNSLLPAHLARLSQNQAGNGSRLYRPFVA